MTMGANNPTEAPQPGYSAAAALDFIKVYFGGACSFGLFGYLYSHGSVGGPVWFLVSVPFVLSVWFGRPGHHLPMAKHLAAGFITAAVGIFWQLGVAEWSALLTPRSLYVAGMLLVVGLGSYAIGSRLGARITRSADERASR
jgi:hypothetical protein